MNKEFIYKLIIKLILITKLLSYYISYNISYLTPKKFYLQTIHVSNVYPNNTLIIYYKNLAVLI
jgi:hypothetical protein